MIGKKVLVIDDILTSGKTINDMTNILKSLGVEDITLFCMFG
jgi:predicted amidophosphoribosyltransferase